MTAFSAASVNDSHPCKMCNLSRESKGTKHSNTARAFLSRFSLVFSRTLGLNEKPLRTTTKSVGSEGQPMENRSVIQKDPARQNCRH